MKLLRLIVPALLAILAGCAGTAPQQNLTDAIQPGYPTRYVATDTSRTVDLTHPPRDAWDRIRRGFAIPNLDTPLVQQWTEYYASHPEALQRMAERAGKYLYYITDEINQRGLPTELALLPFVESAYNPTALSRSKASGLWQFIPTTGQHFKLKQDWWRDERRDPIASTKAALDYLELLFQMQGDWYLALASYNWGEGSVQRAMAKNIAAGLPADYLSLSMPDETRNYVPKLQAFKNIVANPEKYAVTLPPVSNQPYFATVRKTRDIDIDVAARLAEMPLDEFKFLNPSFNRPLIRAEHAPTLILPADRVAVFKANMAAYKGNLSNWQVYNARRGESYAAIAKRFGVAENTLREVNDVPRNRKVALAQNLLIPVTGRGESQGREQEQSGGIQLASLDTSAGTQRGTIKPAVAQTSGTRAAAASRNSPAPNVRQHTVQSGDTLFSLAKRYSTSVDALRALNNLPGNSLKVGSSLRVPGTGVRG